MITVSKTERKIQKRIITLFHDQLQYDYLGDWTDRETNSNIETALLTAYLKRQDYDDNLINRAIYLLEKAAKSGGSLYDRNKAVYELLRYGVKVKLDAGENYKTVWLINWDDPQKNDFAIAEEVTIKGTHTKSYDKRPDIVLYVNGIALAVLELKRSTVSVSEGIRQNLDNQRSIFIQPFFSTIQFIMAANEIEGLYYGAIETKEKYYLTWKEESAIEDKLERQLTQICSKERLLELVHDFVVFDAGTKKLCRHNQYFGVLAAQEFIDRKSVV